VVSPGESTAFNSANPLAPRRGSASLCEEMTMAVMETLKDKAGMLLSSAGDLNKLAIDKVEEITKMNISAASYFSDVGIKQLRAMSGIKDVESMRKFTADTISLSGEIAKKMLDDSKTWMGMSVDMKEKVTDMFAKKDEVDMKKKSAKMAVA
jgi:phasin family protein